MTQLRVFLVDDHTILREGLRALINAQADMLVVGEAADGTPAVDEVQVLQPDVVVMDISLPQLNGAEATRQIKRRCPNIRVLALTAHEDSEYVQLLLEAGASGYLLKRAAAADLVRALRAVALGRTYLDTTMASGTAEITKPMPLQRMTPKVDLSEREADVLQMIARGYSMKRMAATLGLSIRTLETYKSRGMAKLELATRADVVRFALEQGWLKDA